MLWTWTEPVKADRGAAGRAGVLPRGVAAASRLPYFHHTSSLALWPRLLAQDCGRVCYDRCPDPRDPYLRRRREFLLPGRQARELQKVTDANGHATTFSYDVIGRLTTVSNALSQAKNFSYDKVGNLTSASDPDGHSFTFSYDADNRLVTKTLPEGNVTYTYDAVGNLLSATHPNGSKVQFTYDADNRVTQTQQTITSGGSPYTISYTYDANGNRTGMTTPWGSFSYTYDSMNRLLTITNPQSEEITFAYDADGRRIKMDYPNGVETTYAYDAAGELTQILHRRTADNSVVAFANYTYDAAGNRIAMQDTSGWHYYGYDALNRLTSAAHPSGSGLPILNENFGYDAVGNRSSDTVVASYSYDAANRLISDSSYTFTYDANGNLTAKSSGTATTYYTYSSENQMTQAALAKGLTANYRYDAMGRRIEKSTGSATSQDIRYIYDGMNVLAMVDGAGNLIALFTQGPGIDQPLVMHTSATDYYYHADGLGSVLALSNAGAGVVESVEYEAYGRPVITAGSNTFDCSSVGNPFLFTGTTYDCETNLFQMGSRYYDWRIGRFTQQDLIAMAGGLNQFAYARGNPQRYVDPTGTNPILIAVVVGFVAGGVVVYVQNPEAPPSQILAGATLGGAAALAGAEAAVLAGGELIGVAAGAIGGAIGNIAGQLYTSTVIQGGSPHVNWGDVAFSAGSGFIGGAGGYLLEVPAQLGADVGAFAAGILSGELDFMHALGKMQSGNSTCPYGN